MSAIRGKAACRGRGQKSAFDPERTCTASVWLFATSSSTVTPICYVQSRIDDLRLEGYMKRREFIAGLSAATVAVGMPFGARAHKPCRYRVPQ